MIRSLLAWISSYLRTPKPANCVLGEFLQWHCEGGPSKSIIRNIAPNDNCPHESHSRADEGVHEIQVKELQCMLSSFGEESDVTSTLPGS